MADAKISALPSATVTNDADLVAGVQSSTTKSFALNVLAAYVHSKLIPLGTAASLADVDILAGMQSTTAKKFTLSDLKDYVYSKIGGFTTASSLVDADILVGKQGSTLSKFQLVDLAVYMLAENPRTQVNSYKAKTGHWQTVPDGINPGVNICWGNNNQAILTPFYVGGLAGVTQSYDQMAVVVGTASSVASSATLVIHVSDSDGYPGASACVANGTINLAASGFQALTVSATLTPGKYWVSARSTGGTPTGLIVRSASGYNPGVPYIGNLDTTSNKGGLSVTGLTSNPSTFVGQSFTIIGNVPVVALRAV